MAGIFVIHAIAMTTAIFISSINFCRQSKSRKKRIKTEIIFAATGKGSLYGTAKDVHKRGSITVWKSIRRLLSPKQISENLSLASNDDTKSSSTHHFQPQVLLTKERPTLTRTPFHQATERVQNYRNCPSQLNNHTEIDKLHADMRETEKRLVQSMLDQQTAFMESLQNKLNYFINSLQDREKHLVHSIKKEICEVIQNYESSRMHQLEDLQAILLQKIETTSLRKQTYPNYEEKEVLNNMESSIEPDPMCFTTIMQNAVKSGFGWKS